MTLLSKILVAPSLVLLLSSSLYSLETYSIKTDSLSEAITKIAKIAKLPFAVDKNILKGKKANPIKNIEGLEQALKALLKGSGLKAVISNNTIVIVKIKANNSSSTLEDVEVIENSDNTTEGSASYTIGSMNTATKLNLSIKETPQSIKVITNQKIQDHNMQSFEDVSSATAGISMSKSYMTSNQIYSRAFNVDYYQIDGVPTLYDNSNQEDLVIYDRVEIVKGANGLVSGAGNPAASINYIRKRAKNKDFQGSVELKAGSWNMHGATVDLSSALNEKGSLRGRIIASYQKNDSFIDEFSEDKNTFYSVFEADISDNTSLTLTLSKQEFNNKNFNGSGIPIYFTDGSRTNLDKSSNFGADTAYHKSETTSVSAKLEHIFNNDIKVSTNYSYSKNKIDEIRFWNRNDFPNKTTGIYTINTGWNDLETTTTNALDIYASVPFVLGNRNHEFVSGLMYNKNKAEYIWNIENGTKLSSSVYNWDNTTNSGEYVLDEQGKNETKQVGFYSVGKFSLSDNFKLIAGARVSNWEYKKKEKTIEFKNNITPFLGLVYDINEIHSIYTSYTSIFKPQTDNQDKNGKYLDPKEGNNYEIGLKSSFFDDSLNTGITLFRVEQENVAVKDGSNVVLSTSDQAYKLEKGVVSKGIEIDIGGEINDNWNVDFGLAHYNATNNEGERVNTRAPKTQITLSTKYTLNKLSFGAGVNWQSAFYATATNPGTNKEENNTQESYYLVNTMAKYDIKNNLSIQLNVNNLFDKEYYSAIPYGKRYRYGDPRNITMKLNYTF